jgi:hypothetical protein
MDIKSFFMFLAIAALAAGILYAILQVGISVSNNDTTAKMKSSITSAMVVNFIAVFVLAGISYLYITTNPVMERPYTMLMISATMFLSILSISISTLGYV